jgi:DNA-binding NarL/FixJ family response regulator
VLDGGEVARQATRQSPDTSVILYTGADPLLLSSALESGARGFLLKEAPVADLARAVKMVALGGLYLDPALAGFLMESPARHELTRQELEILRLLAEGCTNEAIGARLFLSAETVRTHVRRLMAKLNVHTRTAAVATALRERLIA